ncbi:MAG: DegV family protein [Chloroflexi bacterium]|nr:DegV family protein [Chloroflexota bacterium]
MAVKIVTDSTVDLSPQVAHELGISIVPLSVIFGNDVYREGIDISHDLFYDKLTRSKVLPTTSAPSVGDFLAVYESLINGTDEIISIHVSAKLSATYNNACQAAELLRDRARIEVIDSRSVSLGMGFQVIAAARAADGGAGLDQIKTIVERGADRVHVVFVLDTLEYLRRGGRIGRARAFLGGVLRVKPILSLRDGEVHPEERVRTMPQALERLYQLCLARPRIREVAVGYATTASEAEVLRGRFASALPQVNIYVTRIGPVIGAHAGPGVIGVGVMEGEE